VWEQPPQIEDVLPTPPIQHNSAGDPAGDYLEDPVEMLLRLQKDACAVCVKRRERAALLLG
jgi:hypothetical protein